MSEGRTVLLQVVRESAGKWDSRNIDYELHRRGGALDVSVLQELRELERLGLVSEAPISNGTGPGWELTDRGTTELG